MCMQKLTACWFGSFSLFLAWLPSSRLGSFFWLLHLPLSHPLTLIPIISFPVLPLQRQPPTFIFSSSLSSSRSYPPPHLSLSFSLPLFRFFFIHTAVLETYICISLFRYVFLHFLSFLFIFDPDFFFVPFHALWYPMLFFFFLCYYVVLFFCVFLFITFWTHIASFDFFPVILPHLSTSSWESLLNLQLFSFFCPFWLLDLWGCTSSWESLLNLKLFFFLSILLLDLWGVRLAAAAVVDLLSQIQCTQLAAAAAFLCSFPFSFWIFLFTHLRDILKPLIHFLLFPLPWDLLLMHLIK